MNADLLCSAITQRIGYDFLISVKCCFLHLFIFVVKYKDTENQALEQFFYAK